MKFIHISDIHLVAANGTLHGSRPSERLTACLADICNWHGDAAFCVISGDLAEYGDADSYKLLKDALQNFPLPCFLMIGNHDDRAVFQSVFPDCPKDDHGFVQHKHETDHGIFLFLDTTVDGADAHEGALCARRLGWLKQQLIAAEERPSYLFLHHPPFGIGIPYVDDINLQNAGPFAQALSYGRNIKHVFFGHVHRMTYVNWRGFPFTSLPSLNHQVPLVPASVASDHCDEPPAYSVVSVAEDQLTVHFNTFLQRNPS